MLVRLTARPVRDGEHEALAVALERAAAGVMVERTSARRRRVLRDACSAGSS